MRALFISLILVLAASTGFSKEKKCSTKEAQIYEKYVAQIVNANTEIREKTNALAVAIAATHEPDVDKLKEKKAEITKLKAQVYKKMKPTVDKLEKFAKAHPDCDIDGAALKVRKFYTEK